MNSCAAISGLEAPWPASRAICAFPCGQGLARLRGAFGGALAGRAQLGPGSLGERPGAGGDEDPIGGAKLIAGITPAALAAEPLAVEQADTGLLNAQAAASEAVDRLPVKIFRRLDLGVSRARERASVPSAQSVLAARVVSASRSRAPAARAACPLRTAASISSGKIKVDHSSCGCSLACSAAASAFSYRPRLLYSTAVAQSMQASASPSPLRLALGALPSINAMAVASSPCQAAI